MSTARDVLEGIAALISKAGIATYSTTTAYQSTDTALVFGTMPPSPDRMLVLNFIPLTDDPSLPFGQVMVQVAGRGRPNDPMDVEDLMDQVFDTLQGLTNVPLGGTSATQIYRRTSAPMGQDENTRTERADSYHLDLNYTPTDLRPIGGSW